MAKVKFAVNLFMRREAEFSDDRQYRNYLKIVWNDALPICAFIALNPSTADERLDDNTVRRMRGYAEDWGCGGVVVLNLFAYRSTDPRFMKSHVAPIGGGNTISHIKNRLSECSGPWVAAWGGHGLHMGRGAAVAAAISNLMCLGINGDGTPVHPLYQPKDLQPIPYKIVDVPASSDAL